MGVSLNLDMKQIKELISQLNFDEKVELVEYLDEQTLDIQWDKLKEDKKDIPLSMDFITSEVEASRTERYKI